MKTILSIFGRDLSRIGKNAMALIIAVGISVLPALYAWFNIAANWDPYGNTGGIQVAVANEDAGYSLEGIPLHVGETIVSSLRANDQIGWRFMDRQEAEDGVKSGKYYASVVIPADFSAKLASILTTDIQRPTIEYTINEKKNAIAPKITDKGVGVIQQQINETFTTVATEAVVSGLGAAAGGLESGGRNLMERFMDTLRTADSSLSGVENAIDAFAATSGAVDQLTETARALLPDTQTALGQAELTAADVSTLLTSSREASRQTVSLLGDVLSAAADTCGAAGEQALSLLDEWEARQGDAERLRASVASIQSQLDDTIADNRTLIGKLEQLKQTAPAQTAAALDTAIQRLQGANRTLETLADAVNHLADVIGRGQEVSDTLRGQIAELSSKAADDLRTAAEAGGTFLPELGTAANRAADLLDAVAAVAGDRNEAFQQASARLQASLEAARQRLEETGERNRTLIAALTALKQGIPDRVPAAVDEIIGRLTGANQTLESLSGALDEVSLLIGRGEAVPASLREKLTGLMETGARQYAQAEEKEKGIHVQLAKTVDDAYDALGSASGLLTLFSSAVPQLGQVLDGMGGAMDSATDALLATRKLIGGTRQQIGHTLDRLEATGEDERLQALLDLVRNDSSLMGSFMSSPVQVETRSLYPIANYGSAMAAFYSTLAFWVGGVVLVAILKVRVDEDDRIRRIKPYQSYLGRYLLFFLFGIVQSTIICLGDLHFLGVQCTSPFLFLLAGWTASMVFTLIIYTLTVSFGDVGKALAVIFLVIQIAGAGGTFPIEVTPAFFQGVYPFLPFTYAINAMREIIAGQYGIAYWLDLLKLLVFVPLALLLGLVLRRPLIRLNVFFEKRLENTHLM